MRPDGVNPPLQVVFYQQAALIAYQPCRIKAQPSEGSAWQCSTFWLQLMLAWSQVIGSDCPGVRESLKCSSGDVNKRPPTITVARGTRDKAHFCPAIARCFSFITKCALKHCQILQRKTYCSFQSSCKLKLCERCCNLCQESSSYAKSNLPSFMGSKHLV